LGAAKESGGEDESSKVMAKPKPVVPKKLQRARALSVGIL
jgi:hypothetical protein